MTDTTRAWVTCPKCRDINLARDYGPWLVSPSCSTCRGTGQVLKEFRVGFDAPKGQAKVATGDRTPEG